MHQNEIIVLLKKYQDGSLNIDEKIKLEAWYANQLGKSGLQLSESELEHSYEVLKSRLGIEKKPKVVQLWTKIAAAAAIVIFVSTTVFYFINNGSAKKDSIEQVVYENAAVKSDKTILTLANGKKIELTHLLKKDSVAKNIKVAGMIINVDPKGVITYQLDPSDNTTNNDKLAINTLETPYGDQYNLILADGTKVYLNASTTIKYPTRFSGNQRIVDIEGEAFFEVAKDKEKPFIVRTANHEIKVLGTHFNVNTFKEDGFVKTTLLEGSVAIHYNGKNAVLKPGQQSLVTYSSNSIVVNQADIESVIAWKSGKFKFDNADIKTVMKQLQRWYGINIEYHGKMEEVTFNGGTYMNKDLKEVLKVLEVNSDMKFKVEGKTVIVSP